MTRLPLPAAGTKTNSWSATDCLPFSCLVPFSNYLTLNDVVSWKITVARCLVYTQYTATTNRHWVFRNSDHGWQEEACSRHAVRRRQMLCDLTSSCEGCPASCWRLTVNQDDRGRQNGSRQPDCQHARCSNKTTVTRLNGSSDSVNGDLQIPMEI